MLVGRFFYAWEVPLSTEERYRAFCRLAREAGVLVAQGYTPGFVLKFGPVILTTKATSAAISELVRFAADPKIRPSESFLEDILALRIPRTDLANNTIERYIWRQDVADEVKFVTLDDWMKGRGYRRKQSSPQLEQVASVAPAS